MMSSTDAALTAEQVLQDLERFIEEAVKEAGTTEARRPSHRVPFRWPPHAVSADYHVLKSDWTGQATLVADGREYPVLVARTAYGVFGRCEAFWVEARGETDEHMLQGMRIAVEPLFVRQRMIAQTIGLPGRYEGKIRDLNPSQLVRLLYCPDRDIANEARIEIETHASSQLFTAALVRILRDERHPDRRIAQWCVLDLYEDLPSFCPTPDDVAEAIRAVHDFIYHAPDDYARSTYKAGVVLGGHVATDQAADALLDCVQAPSRYGRRSAIHACFHLAEWLPQRTPDIVATLRRAAEQDPEPQLRSYAAQMASDIERSAADHIIEPIFSDEL